jgi:hypothetical protein
MAGAVCPAGNEGERVMTDSPKPDSTSAEPPVSAEMDRQPEKLLSSAGGSDLCCDPGKLKELGRDMGDLFAEFMIKQIDAREIDSAPAFASRCANAVHDVREDMQGDGYSDEQISIYIDSCMARMKEKFSAYRSGLFLAGDHKGGN